VNSSEPWHKQKYCLTNNHNNCVFYVYVLFQFYLATFLRSIWFNRIVDNLTLK
jgi:hypothetical protein